MNKRVIKLLAAGSLGLAVAAVLAGCGSCKPGKPGKAGQYDIEVTLDSSLKTSSVIVDLVGISPSDLPRWEAYDMGKYWHEGDPMRQDADRYVLDFIAAKTSSLTLAATNKEAWTRWQALGVRYLMVLADLPGSQASRPGNQDSRRQILPLDKCNWVSGTKKINVLVQRSGIKVLTPARPTQ